MRVCVCLWAAWAIGPSGAAAAAAATIFEWVAHSEAEKTKDYINNAI